MDKDFNFFAKYIENSGTAKILKFLNIKKILIPVLILIVVGGTAYHYYYVQNQKKVLEEELSSKETIRNTLQQEVADYNSQQIDGELDPVLEVDEINQLKELEALVEMYDAKIDYRVLLGINNSLPPGVFIESIQLATPGNVSQSTLLGYSLTSNYIADFQNNLRNNPRFENIYISQIINEPDKGFAFSLSMHIIEENMLEENIEEDNDEL